MHLPFRSGLPIFYRCVSAACSHSFSSRSLSFRRPPFALPIGPAAPNCDLEVLPDLALPIYVTASGEARIYFDIPLDASLAGAIVDSQWWILDPAANALGLAASQRGTAIVE